MEENKMEENKTEELKQESGIKQETVKTFNEAKEQMKNINLKDEVEVGKGLLKKLWQKPVETIKEIAADEEIKAFKTALLLVVIWMFVAAIKYSLSHLSFNFLSVLKEVLAPALKIIAMTVAFCIVNDRVKDTLSKVITSMSIAYIPSIISSILWLLRYVSVEMLKILSPISGLLSVISTILIYHSVKALSQENDDTKALKTFVKVELVFYIIAFALSFLGISI